MERTGTRAAPGTRMAVCQASRRDRKTVEPLPRYRKGDRVKVITGSGPAEMVVVGSSADGLFVSEVEEYQRAFHEHRDPIVDEYLWELILDDHRSETGRWEG